MTTRSNALRGVDDTTHRRSPRVPGLRAPGTWPTNYFRSPLVDVQGQDPNNLDVVLQNFDLSNGLSIPVLLFTSDVPIDCIVRSEYAAIQVEDAAQTSPIDLPAPADFPEGCALISDEATQAPALLTPLVNTSPVVEKQASVGTTDTNAVRVTGFMGVITLTDRGIESPLATPQLPTLSLKCVAENAVVHGPVTSFDATGVAGDPTSSQSIIMNEAAYTQAMFDAGNLFVDGAGVVNHIVGLWGPQFTE